MKKMANTMLPPARKESLLVKEMADETLVYDLKNYKAHCLNESAALIWKHCDGKTSAAEMARILQAKYKTPVDEKVIWMGVDGLNKARLLQKTALSVEVSGISRREVMRKIGIGAAVSIPIISSIVAPTAAQAATAITPATCAGRRPNDPGGCGNTPCTTAGTTCTPNSGNSPCSCK